MARIGGLVSFLLAGAWVYRWEAIRAYLYGKGFDVMGLVETDTLLQWGMPLLLAGTGLFLFWKTGNSPLPDWEASFPFSRVPFDDAARRVYEAAEKANTLDLMVSATSKPEDKLNHFKMLLLVEDRVRLFGARPPSTQSLLIPKEELQREIYPSEKASNALDHLIPGDHPPAFVNVTVPRSDLRHIIKIYLTEYVAEAKQLRSGRWPR